MQRVLLNDEEIKMVSELRLLTTAQREAMYLVIRNLASTAPEPQLPANVTPIHQHI